MSLAVGALRLLPRNLLSRAAGRFAALRLPPALVHAEIRAFARAVGVDLTEVRDPLDVLRARCRTSSRARSRDGARPIDPARRRARLALRRRLGRVGHGRDGHAAPAEGPALRARRRCSASDEDAARFEGGAYATFYLSPRDYHRFHAPCAARVERAVYLPGHALAGEPASASRASTALFAQNERICAFMRAAAGRRASVSGRGRRDAGRQGAGRLRRARDEPARRARDPAQLSGGVALAQGEEWGRFEFGSTLVLLAEPGKVALEARAAGTPVRLGERIGTLRKVV